MKDYYPHMGLTEERPDQAVWNLVGSFPLMFRLKELARQIKDWEASLITASPSASMYDAIKLMENKIYDILVEKHGKPSAELAYLPGIDPTGIEDERGLWERLGFQFVALSDGPGLENAVR